MGDRIHRQQIWSRGLFVLLMGLSGCDGEALPSVNDVSYADGAVFFDSNLSNGMGPCVRRTEVCNGQDDDCDGTVDEEEAVRMQVFADPENCGQCGYVCQGPNANYGCRVGLCIIDQCEPGFVDYNGDASDGCEADCVITAGGREMCDQLDNDCDGSIDEGFNLMDDMNHCGACQNVCEETANALSGCVEGTCVVSECDGDWHDLNGSLADGCEYECAIRSSREVREYCNGLDDDCDGLVDEVGDLHRPQATCGLDGACAFECVTDRGCEDGERCGDGRICVPVDAVEASCETDLDCRQIHPGLACIAQTLRNDGQWVTTHRCVERTHDPMCDGESGFRCTRSPQWQRGNEDGRCDGIDNDCDGRIDEDFAEQLFLADRSTPRPCVSGTGLCQTNGQVICHGAGDGTVCSADPLMPETDVDSTCDGVDEDCDGIVDEDFDDAVIQIGPVEIFAYEASRPGATAERRGRDENPEDDVEILLEGRACSRPGVLPWDDVSWSQAQTACEAANARLCTAAEWAGACGGPNGQAYPYGVSFRNQLCNGREYDVDAEAAGVQDGALVCGAMDRCVRDGVYDLSGNLKEWVSDSIGNLRAVRGGSYATVLAGGLSCDQDGDWKDRNFHHRSIGFRCCRD